MERAPSDAELEAARRFLKSPLSLDEMLESRAQKLILYIVARAGLAKKFRPLATPKTPPCSDGKRRAANDANED